MLVVKLLCEHPVQNLLGKKRDVCQLSWRGRGQQQQERDPRHLPDLTQMPL